MTHGNTNEAREDRSTIRDHIVPRGSGYRTTRCGSPRRFYSNGGGGPYQGTQVLVVMAVEDQPMVGLMAMAVEGPPWRAPDSSFGGGGFGGTPYREEVPHQHTTTLMVFDPNLMPASTRPFDQEDSHTGGNTPMLLTWEGGVITGFSGTTGPNTTKDVMDFSYEPSYTVLLDKVHTSSVSSSSTTTDTRPMPTGHL
jgi:hypothetical protein